MQENKFVLVNASVLPPVFEGVIYAKQLLADGTAANATQAVKMAGISRSAFYKYRDFVFAYNPQNSGTINLLATLTDKAGVLSSLTTALYNYGANIITVNQSIPVNGAASASLTVSTENLQLSVEDLLDALQQIEGAISIKAI